MYDAHTGLDQLHCSIVPDEVNMHNVARFMQVLVMNRPLVLKFSSKNLKVGSEIVTSDKLTSEKVTSLHSCCTLLQTAHIYYNKKKRACTVLTLFFDTAYFECLQPLLLRAYKIHTVNHMV